MNIQRLVCAHVETFRFVFRHKIFEFSAGFPDEYFPGLAAVCKVVPVKSINKIIGTEFQKSLHCRCTFFMSAHPQRSHLTLGSKTNDFAPVIFECAFTAQHNKASNLIIRREKYFFFIFILKPFLSSKLIL